jgi:hypothetical protein
MNTGLSKRPFPVLNATAVLAVGDTVYVGGRFGGFFVSHDRCKTWIEPDSINDWPWSNTLARLGNRIFLGGNQSLFISSNEGRSWDMSGIPQLAAVNALLVKDSLIFAGTLPGGLFVSSDSGRTWADANNGLFPFPDVMIDVLSLGLQGNKLFTGTLHGVSVSTDNGGSWNPVASGMYGVLVAAFCVQGSSVYAGTILPGGGGIFVSPDGGGSWTGAGLDGQNVNGLAAEDNTLIAGTDRGIFVSTDHGANWTDEVKGLFAPSVVALAPGSGRVYAGAGGFMFGSTDEGSSWAMCGLPYQTVNSLTASGDTVIAGTNGDVFRSTDFGLTWTSGGLTHQNISALTEYGRNLVAANSHGVIYQSGNFGGSWTPIGTGMPSDSVTFIVAAPSVSGGSNIFAGAWGDGIYMSSDSGKTWWPVKTGFTSRYPTCLASVGSVLSAGTAGNGIFVSTDNGSHWQTSSAGLADSNVTSIAAVGSYLLVGTNGGAFISSNSGSTWVKASDGLVDNHIGSVALSGSSVFLGTQSKGIWKRSISDVTAIGPREDHLPGGFGLYQNYPNPFNPTTTIRYALPSRAHVTLSVFNTLGQAVATLVNESQETGNHEVRFDGSSLASGVYFYRIRAGEYVETKKLVILR